MTSAPHTEPTAYELQTLVDLLRWRGTHQPDQLAFTFLPDGMTDEVRLTFGELDRRAQAIGARLQHLQAQGERVMLLYPSGLDYITAFFGCLYAGAVAVPGYPPRFQRSLEHLQIVATDAQATIALTTAALLDKIQHWFTWMPTLSSLHWVATDDLDGDLASSWQPPALDGESLAILQYTSSSTRFPRGVMFSHDNLLINSRDMQRALGHTDQSISVGWLPLQHDMGLLGNVLQPLYMGFHCILMSPMSFLQRPVRWLQAISRYRGTSSGGPNFAYNLCLRKITPEQRRELDLRSWEVALNGAEPIQPGTLEQFAAVFEPCGFRPQAFYSCYGLSGSTLMVSGGAKHAVPVVRRVQKAALEQRQIAIPCISKTGEQVLVSYGKGLGQQVIRIVDPETRTRCRPRHVGEIWVAGASVAQGYWNQPNATRDVFQARLADTGEGPFLRTGDLGFLHQKELFITGRLQDVIIIRAQTYYPQDIEATVAQCHPALRPNSGAAFAVDMQGEARLVIVQEVEDYVGTPANSRAEPAVCGPEPSAPALDIDALMGTIRQLVAEKHGVQVSELVLIRAGSMIKASSGNIRRQVCRDRFLNQTLNRVGHWRVTYASVESIAGEMLTGEAHARRELEFFSAPSPKQGGHIA